MRERWYANLALSIITYFDKFKDKKMDYFETKIAPTLYSIRDNKANGQDNTKEEMELRILFDRAAPEIAYELLENLNRKKNELFDIFNNLVSYEKKTEIRKLLLKTYINNLDINKLQLLFDKINKKTKPNIDVDFLLFNGVNSGDRPIDIKYLVALLEKRVRNILITALDEASRLTEDRLGDSKRITKPALSVSKKFTAINNRFPLSDFDRKSIEEIDTEAFSLSESKRKDLEEATLSFSLMNHADFIAAVLQFNYDLLEKRVSRLEKANESSWFGFVVDLFFNFALPFGIGKIAKAVLPGIVAKKDMRDFISRFEDSRIQDMFTSIPAANLVYIKRELSNRVPLLSRPIASHIVEHSDDYTQFGADFILKTRAHYQNQSTIVFHKNQNKKYESISDFIAEALADSRSAFVELQKNIYQYPDRYLQEENNRIIGLNFEVYYSGMKAKYEEYLEQERRARSSASPSAMPGYRGPGPSVKQP